MQKIETKKILNILTDIIFYVVGGFLYGISVTVFTAPNDIAPGGITGLSTILNHLWPILPIGTMILVINIPLFIVSTSTFGWKFLLKSLAGTAVTSITIDITAAMPFIEPFKGDMMLAAIYAGVTSGIGLGMVLMRGSTTGGTDIVAKLLKLKFPYISLGKLILVSDAVIILIAWIVYGNIESPLYAIITIFINTKVVDFILNGSDIGRGKVMFIITGKCEEITKEIIQNMERSVTILDSRGGYSNIPSNTLICTIKPGEVSKVYDIIKKYDKKAFTFTVNAKEVTGEGWKPADEKR